MAEQSCFTMSMLVMGITCASFSCASPSMTPFST